MTYTVTKKEIMTIRGSTHRRTNTGVSVPCSSLTRLPKASRTPLRTLYLGVLAFGTFAVSAASSSLVLSSLRTLDLPTATSGVSVSALQLTGEETHAGEKVREAEGPEISDVPSELSEFPSDDESFPPDDDPFPGSENLLNHKDKAAATALLAIVEKVRNGRSRDGLKDISEEDLDLIDQYTQQDMEAILGKKLQHVPALATDHNTGLGGHQALGLDPEKWTPPAIRDYLRDKSMTRFKDVTENPVAVLLALKEWGKVHENSASDFLLTTYGWGAFLDEGTGFLSKMVNSEKLRMSVQIAQAVGPWKRDFRWEFRQLILFLWKLRMQPLLGRPVHESDNMLEKIRLTGNIVLFSKEKMNYPEDLDSVTGYNAEFFRVLLAGLSTMELDKIKVGRNYKDILNGNTHGNAKSSGDSDRAAYLADMEPRTQSEMLNIGGVSTPRYPKLLDHVRVQEYLKFAAEEDLRWLYTTADHADILGHPALGLDVPSLLAGMSDTNPLSEERGKLLGKLWREAEANRKRRTRTSAAAGKTPDTDRTSEKIAGETPDNGTDRTSTCDVYKIPGSSEGVLRLPSFGGADVKPLRGLADKVRAHAAAAAKKFTPTPGEEWSMDKVTPEELALVQRCVGNKNPTIKGSITKNPEDQLIWATPVNAALIRGDIKVTWRSPAAKDCLDAYDGEQKIAGWESSKNIATLQHWLDTLGRTQENGGLKAIDILKMQSWGGGFIEYKLKTDAGFKKMIRREHRDLLLQRWAAEAEFLDSPRAAREKIALFEKLLFREDELEYENLNEVAPSENLKDNDKFKKKSIKNTILPRNTPYDVDFLWTMMPFIVEHRQVKYEYYHSSKGLSSPPATSTKSVPSAASLALNPVLLRNFLISASEEELKQLFAPSEGELPEGNRLPEWETPGDYRSGAIRRRALMMIINDRHGIFQVPDFETTFQLSTSGAEQALIVTNGDSIDLHKRRTYLVDVWPGIVDTNPGKTFFGFNHLSESWRKVFRQNLAETAKKVSEKGHAYREEASNVLLNPKWVPMERSNQNDHMHLTRDVENLRAWRGLDISYRMHVAQQMSVSGSRKRSESTEETQDVLDSREDSVFLGTRAVTADDLNLLSKYPEDSEFQSTLSKLATWATANNLVHSASNTSTGTSSGTSTATGLKDGREFTAEKLISNLKLARTWQKQLWKPKAEGNGRHTEDRAVGNRLILESREWGSGYVRKIWDRWEGRKVVRFEHHKWLRNEWISELGRLNAMGDTAIDPQVYSVHLLEKKRLEENLKWVSENKGLTSSLDTPWNFEFLNSLDGHPRLLAEVVRTADDYSGSTDVTPARNRTEKLLKKLLAELSMDDKEQVPFGYFVREHILAIAELLNLTPEEISKVKERGGNIDIAKERRWKVGILDKEPGEDGKSKGIIAYPEGRAEARAKLRDLARRVQIELDYRGKLEKEGENQKNAKEQQRPLPGRGVSVSIEDLQLLGLYSRDEIEEWAVVGSPGPQGKWEAWDDDLKLTPAEKANLLQIKDWEDQFRTTVDASLEQFDVHLFDDENHIFSGGWGTGFLARFLQDPEQPDFSEETKPQWATETGEDPAKILLRKDEADEAYLKKLKRVQNFRKSILPMHRDWMIREWRTELTQLQMRVVGAKDYNAAVGAEDQNAGHAAVGAKDLQGNRGLPGLSDMEILQRDCLRMNIALFEVELQDYRLGVGEMMEKAGLFPKWKKMEYVLNFLRMFGEVYSERGMSVLGQGHAFILSMVLKNHEVWTVTSYDLGVPSSTTFLELLPLQKSYQESHHPAVGKHRRNHRRAVGSAVSAAEGKPSSLKPSPLKPSSFLELGGPSSAKEAGINEMREREIREHYPELKKMLTTLLSEGKQAALRMINRPDNPSHGLQPNVRKLLWENAKLFHLNEEERGLLFKPEYLKDGKPVTGNGGKKNADIAGPGDQSSKNRGKKIGKEDADDNIEKEGENDDDEPACLATWKIVLISIGSLLFLLFILFCVGYWYVNIREAPALEHDDRWDKDSLEDYDRDYDISLTSEELAMKEEYNGEEPSWKGLKSQRKMGTRVRFHSDSDDDDSDYSDNDSNYSGDSDFSEDSNDSGESRGSRRGSYDSVDSATPEESPSESLDHGHSPPQLPGEYPGSYTEKLTCRFGNRYEEARWPGANPPRSGESGESEPDSDHGSGPSGSSDNSEGAESSGSKTKSDDSVASESLEPTREIHPDVCSYEEEEELSAQGFAEYSEDRVRNGKKKGPTAGNGEKMERIEGWGNVVKK